MLRVQPLPAVTSHDAEPAQAAERAEPRPALVQPAVYVVRSLGDGHTTGPSVGIQPVADNDKQQGIFGRLRTGPAAPAVAPPAAAPQAIAPPATEPVPQAVTPATSTVPRGTTAENEARILATSLTPGNQAIPPAELMRRVGDLAGVAPVDAESAPRGVTRAQLEEQQRSGAIVGFRELPGGVFEVARLRSPDDFARAVRGRLTSNDIVTGLSRAAREDLLRVTDGLRTPAMADALRAQTPEQVIAGLRGATDTPAQRLAGNLRLQGWTITQATPNDAVLARGRVGDYPRPVNFVIPPHFTPTRDGRVDLNLHISGYPLSRSVPNALYPQFGNWATITNAFRGITVLPENPGRNDHLHAWLPRNGAGFEAFMDASVRRLAAAGAMPIPAGTPDKAVRAFSLTSHSGGYAISGPLANATNRYASRLRGVGLFDSTYGFNDQFVRAARALEGNRGVFMAIGTEGHDTGTNVVSIAAGLGRRPLRLSAGQHPPVNDTIIIGNQTNRGDQSYYVTTQHYGVQIDHMNDFFRALEQRLPPR